jgi:hypothetical protein
MDIIMETPRMTFEWNSGVQVRYSDTQIKANVVFFAARERRWPFDEAVAELAKNRKKRLGLQDDQN